MEGTLEISLTLRKTDTPIAERVAAWYLGSGKVGDWIEEVTRWEAISQDELRFHPVPESARNPRPRGVVIRRDGSEFPAGHEPWRGVGLRLVCGKLLVPLDAELHYPVSVDEVRELIHHDFQVLLPGDRRVTFDADEGLALHDLIAGMPESKTDWSRAVAADDFRPRLRGIGVMRLPDFDEVMDSGKEDIGDSDPGKLPKKPGESGIGNGLRDLANAPGKAFYGTIRKLTGMAPGGASSATWIDKVEGWANRKLGDLAGKQSRELDRLLDLLKSNPDRGLNFALPLTGGFSGRGMTDPGASLTWRNTSFSLSNLFGSGEAIAPWMLPDDRYLQLQQAYRDAANRELKIGRYRRAAYIFGQLLGDLHAAANALEQGGFYREAAVIYEKKLNDSENAARAFREGGLFEEALRLYRGLKQFETIAELLRELGREDEALEAYELALEDFLARNLPIEAARIAETGLGDERRALEIYRNAWPGSREAGECLRRELELLGKWGAHDEAAERLEHLAENPWGESQTRTLVGELIRVKEGYPNAAVAELAGDAARRAVANRLKAACRVERSLLRLVGDIEREDRLLGRDARRFGDRKLNLPKPDLARPGMAGSETVTIEPQGERHHSPEGASAIEACGFDGGIAIAKLTSHELMVTYEPGQGIISNVRWPIPDALELPEFVTRLRLVPIRSRSKADDSAIIVWGLGTEDFRMAEPPTSDGMAIGSSPLFTPNRGFLAAASTLDGQTWGLRFFEGDFKLESYHKGNLLASHSLNLTDGAGEELTGGRITMACSRTQVFFSYGRMLFRWQNGQLTGIEFSSPIIDLVTTGNTSLSRIAVAMEQGAAVAWGERQWPYHEVIGNRDLINARVGFTLSNHLIVAGPGSVQAYAVGAESVTLQGSRPVEKFEDPLCVAPRPESDSFEVVTRKGMTHYRLQPTRG